MSLHTTAGYLGSGYDGVWSDDVDVNHDFFTHRTV